MRLRRTRLRRSGGTGAGLVLAGLAAMLLAGGCGGASASQLTPQAQPASAPASAATHDSGPPWFSYQRPAGYAVAVSPVRVPTRDGTELACALYRPAGTGGPAPGRFPAIVSQLLPYYGQYLTPTDNEPARYLAARGYTDVVCAMRGTYDSGGRFPGWFTAGDGSDDYDLIEWAAKQPWSTGRVGQEGASYGGINTLRVASESPPHLVAIAPQFAFHNAYLDYFYPGGISNDISQSPAIAVTDSRGVTPAQQWATWQAHPLDDAFWKQTSLDTAKVSVPTLMVGGWSDYMVRGDVANDDALARANTWFVIGPWYHNGEPPAQISPMLLLWFDHWLKRLPGATLPAARVTSFEMPLQGGRGWRQLAAYPPPGARSVRLDLRTDGTLSATAGTAGSRSYTVNPHDGPAAICFPGANPCDATANVAAADARRLTFTTSPLQSDLVIAGSISVHLRAALAATDGNLVVKVMDVAPGGAVHQASVGYLRASHRLSQSHPTALTPNQPTDFVVSVWPMDWRFRVGHRLRISLTSGDYPKLAPDAPAGTVTVATGEHGSYIDLLAASGY